jgi:hypothetical protein
MLQIVPRDCLGLSVGRSQICKSRALTNTAESSPDEMVNCKYRLAESPVTDDNAEAISVERFVNGELESTGLIRNRDQH